MQIKVQIEKLPTAVRWIVKETGEEGVSLDHDWRLIDLKQQAFQAGCPEQLINNLVDAAVYWGYCSANDGTTKG